MRTKKLSKEYNELVSGFPNFHNSGNITGMKRKYYDAYCLLVRCGNYIYNVTSKPEIYFDLAK